MGIVGLVAAVAIDLAEALFLGKACKPSEPFGQFRNAAARTGYVLKGCALLARTSGVAWTLNANLVLHKSFMKS
jgi:hypothetical protein